MRSYLLWWSALKEAPEHRPPGGIELRRHTREALTYARLVLAANSQQNVRKWTGLAANGVNKTTESLRLADFFSIKRGLATGDNKFFILSRAEIEARGLPHRFFKPILPGPRYLSCDVIEAEADGRPKIERQQFYSDCRLPENVVRKRFPELWSYLKTGKPRVSGTYRLNQSPKSLVCPRKPATCAVRLHLYGSQPIEAREALPIHLQSLTGDLQQMCICSCILSPRWRRLWRPTLALGQLVWKFLDFIPAETLLKGGASIRWRALQDGTERAG